MSKMATFTDGVIYLSKRFMMFTRVACDRLREVCAVGRCKIMSELATVTGDAIYLSRRFMVFTIDIWFFLAIYCLTCALNGALATPDLQPRCVAPVELAIVADNRHAVPDPT